MTAEPAIPEPSPLDAALAYGAAGIPVHPVGGENTPWVDPLTKRASELRRGLLSAADAKPSLDEAPLVERWLDHGTLSVVYGEPGAGKSFFALDLAAHVAEGRPWNGCRVSAGPVLYVASEGKRGFMNRLAAIERGAAPWLHVLTEPPDLCRSPIDAQALAEIAMEAAGQDLPRLIVIDTLARAMGRGDENSSPDMGALIAAVDWIRDATGAHVLLVHHAGKDRARGARGHSSLKAAIDTEIEITASDGVSVATVRKQRDLPSGGVFAFTLESVEIGRNRSGEPVTSCRVTPTAAPESQAPAAAMRGNMRAVRDALAEFLGTHGKPGGDAWSGLGEVRVADLDAFKAFARDRMAHGTAKLRAKAVRVAIEGLAKGGWIAVRGGDLALIR